MIYEKDMIEYIDATQLLITSHLEY